MSQKDQLKNYYETLGVGYDASIFDIENAYQNLAAKWHPDKHKTDRVLAQKKFNQISEAYEVLSDRNKRSHYNDMLQMQFSKEDAHRTFDQFFGQQGIYTEEEQDFFNTYYPEKTKNYYRILGVSKDSTLDEIKEAYRKLALKYHPKKNSESQEAHKKFIQINEAYNALSNELKRNTYDDILFSQIQPIRAHNIFDDFFGARSFQWPQEEQFLKPIINRSWRKRLDNMMDIQTDFGEIENGQSYKSSTVYSNNNGVQSKKSVTTKRNVKNGKAIEQRTEEYGLPSGQKEIIKTIKDGQNVTTKKYTLKKGEQLPKQLCN